MNGVRLWDSTPCKAPFSLCFHSYCIEHVTIFPTCILALMIGVYSYIKLKQIPTLFPSKWLYQLLFLSFGIMMSTAGILHCFIHDTAKLSDSLWIEILRFIFTTVDVGLTSNIAVAFAWAGAADLNWINPCSKKCKLFIFSSFVIVFICWIVGLSLNLKYAFLILYMCIICLCCGFYLISQLILYVKEEDVAGWNWFIAGGIFGLIGFGALINPFVCSWLYPISSFINPEFIWFYCSDLAMFCLFVFVSQKK